MFSKQQNISPPIFITGIGTGVGKTVVAAIIAEALGANYWKPIQTGATNNTSDAAWVASVTSNSTIYPEAYSLTLPASPHLAAMVENISITIQSLLNAYQQFQNHSANKIVIEGAGGLLVPLNEKEMMIDLMMALQAKVIIVSRNYLGSINHSLLTAVACKQYNLNVLGWIFNDHFMNYEEELVQRSGFPALASIPATTIVNKNFITQQALRIKKQLTALL
jgi:dethiobiotin synthetase